MNRMTTIALVSALAMTMTGCDALDAILGYNMFASFAAVDAKEIAKADAATLVELSDSDSFYDTLEGDAALKDTTLTKIDVAMDAADPSSSTYQELAVLAANIELQTTPAWDLINNVSSLVPDLLEGIIPDIDSFDGIIDGLVPASARSPDGTINEAAFSTMIAGLLSANDYYVDLGSAISTEYENDPDTISGQTTGDIAQSAVVAAIIAGIDPPDGYTTSTYLFALLTDPAIDTTSTPPDGFDYPEVDSGSYLSNIIIAAGYSLVEE